MILGHNEIHNRISKGEVFRKGTSDPGCVRESATTDATQTEMTNWHPGWLDQESVLVDRNDLR